MKFLNWAKLNLKSYQSKSSSGKWGSTLQWPLEVHCRVKKVQRHYETERKRRKEGRKKADKFRKTMQSWCRDTERGREGGGDGKSSGELLHYLVPLVDAGDGGARAAPLQIPILFAARNRFCICPNEMMLLQKTCRGWRWQGFDF